MVVAELGIDEKTKQKLKEYAQATRNPALMSVRMLPDVKERMEKYVNVIKEELTFRMKFNPVFRLAEKVYDRAKNVRMTRSQIWSTWFVPLKMWVKGHPLLFARKVEKEILNSEGYLTLDEAFLKAMKKARHLDYLPWLAAGIASTVNNDFDFMMAIIGYEGMGKSSLALALARDLQAFGFEFNIFDNIFFGSTPVDEIISRIENSQRQVFIFDEADSFFDSRNSMKKWQKDLIRAIVMGRARNHVYLLATPDIHGIDIRFRERRVTHLLHLIDRNLVALLLKHTVGKDRDGFKYDHIMSKIKRIPPNSRLIAKAFMETDTCYGVFSLSGPPISEEHYAFYKELKMELNKITAINTDQTGGKVILSAVLYSLLKSKRGQEFIEYLSHKTKYPDIVFNKVIEDVLREMHVPQKAIKMFLSPQQAASAIIHEAMATEVTAKDVSKIASVVRADANGEDDTLDEAIEEYPEDTEEVEGENEDKVEEEQEKEEENLPF